MVKLKLSLLLIICCLLFPAYAYSYNLAPWQLTGGDFVYKINSSSFSTLNGRTLNTSQARYWVQTAVSKWVTKTGADLQPDYTGDTTASCANHSDGINTIGVRAGTAPLGQATTNYYTGSGNVIEWDICIFADAADWEVIANNMGTGERDLIGTLVHEVGHVFGLDHFSGATMNSTTLTGNNNRHLFADDIKGIRAKYPTLSPMGLRSYWRKWNSGWGSRVSMPFSDHFRPIRGAIGAGWVVATTINEGVSPYSPTKISFYRSSYPLSTSSGWAAKTFTIAGAWDSPAIASNHNGGAFLAAVPRRTELDSGCLGMEFYYSTNVFNTVTKYTYGNMCSTDSPALAWNEYWDKWVLVWVDHNQVEENTNRLMYSTSSDGLYWATPRALGAYSLETPGLACHASGSGECLLTYTRASSLSPTVVQRKITFNSSGIVSLGSWNQHRTNVQREVSAAARGFSSWHTSWSYYNNGDWRSKGWGGLYSKSSTSNPPVGSSVFSGEYAEHPGALVGSENYSNLYLFYVD